MTATDRAPAAACEGTAGALTPDDKRYAISCIAHIWRLPHGHFGMTLDGDRFVDVHADQSGVTVHVTTYSGTGREARKTGRRAGRIPWPDARRIRSALIAPKPTQGALFDLETA